MTHEPGHQPPQVVIFDFFGVICSPMSPLTGAAFAKNHGLDPDKFAECSIVHGKALDLGEMTAEHFAAAIIKHFDLPDSMEEVRDELYDLDTQYYAAHASTIQIINQLKSQATVVLMSNVSRGLSAHLAQLGAYDMFDHVYLSSHYGLAKPDINWYKLVQKDLKITDDSQLMLIDDNAANIDVAHTAGWLKSVVYSGETKLADQLRHWGFDVKLPNAS